MKIGSAVCNDCGARIEWSPGAPADVVIAIAIQHRVDAHGEKVEGLVDRAVLTMLPAEELPRA